MKTRNLLSLFIGLLLIIVMTAQPVSSKLSSDNNAELQSSSSSFLSNSTVYKSSLSNLSVPDLFEKVKSSVVKISPYSKYTNSSLMGSGFVYDKAGHIITNSHVAGTAPSVIVTFADGIQYDAVVLGIDHVNDISVLKITENHTQPLLPVQFGNSSAQRIGEQVFAIGNPYGLANSLTSGLISQVGRLISETGSEAPYPHPDMIQTDANINPGNSGGPLVNSKGQVIGMNTATLSSQLGGATGLGFSIPSNTLLREIPVLIKSGSYPHPWLGIAAQTLNIELKNEIGLGSKFRGVMVTSLVEGGPAGKAGIHSPSENFKVGKSLGDIITALDGVPISDTHGLLSYVENKKTAGEKTIVSIFRNNQTNNFTVTLGERPISLYTSKSISASTPLY
jgi:S1-C subfamily serine protease